MSLLPLPTPCVRLKALDLGVDAAFTGAVPFTYNATTKKWTFIANNSLHDQQLDLVATAIEKLLLQDFSQPLDQESFLVNPVYDVDGTTVLSAGFSVKVNQVGNLPSTFDIGVATGNSVGLTWSLRTAIRQTLGIGTPYVPPVGTPTPTPPAAFIRLKTIELDDEPSFAGAVQFGYTAATKKWTFGAMTLHEQHLDRVASAIERLYQQDFAALSMETEAYNLNTVFDVDGTTVLAAAFSIKLNQASGLPTTFDVGTATNTSLGLAWSLESVIRNTLNVGTPFVP